MWRELLCQSLRPVKGLGMLRLCCVNPGYQSICRGSSTAVGNNGSQYLQLLIKDSKWKLGIKAGYRATIANEYSKPAFCLTGLGCASPGLQVSVISPICDTFQRLLKSPKTESSPEQISVSTQPHVLAGTFGTGRQVAECGCWSFDFCVSFW